MRQTLSIILNTLPLFYQRIKVHHCISIQSRQNTIIKFYSFALFCQRILSTSNRIPTRRQSQIGSHVYFLLIIAMVILLTSDSAIVTSEQCLYQTIVQFDKTIVLPRKLATGNIHDYLSSYCPLVGILFEVLRIKDSFDIIFQFNISQSCITSQVKCIVFLLNFKDRMFNIPVFIKEAK